MKPFAAQRRPKEWIPFTNYALVKSVPKALKLQEHLVPYEGAEADEGYLWGLYGTLASNQGLFLADAAAQRRGLIPLTIQGWYRLDNFDRVRAQIDQSIAEESGFLHLERLKAAFREEVKEVALTAATALERRTFADESLGALLVRCPRLVKAIFAEYRKVSMIVHPVRQLYDPEDRRPLTVCTMRLIRSRVMAVEVRYVEGIKVNY